MSFARRVVEGVYLMLVGLAFGVRGVIALRHPHFWEPVTDLDYAAVWTHSLALLLTAPAFIILARRAQAGPRAVTVAWVIAAAAVLTAVANAIEDGLDREGFGVVYVLSVLPFLLGLITLSILLFMGEHKAFGLVPLLTVLGLFSYEAGGGLLIGATWTVLGIRVVSGATDLASSDTGDSGEPDRPQMGVS